MADPKPFEMRTCPYNKAHQVEHYRMHVHLQKCRKQYPNEPVSPCPFDASHIVRDLEMDFHVETCPKRVMLDNQIYVMDDDHRPVVEVQPSYTNTNCSENWDDGYAPSYDPLAAKKGAPIIMKSIKGATKSERKAARIAGRHAYVEAMKNKPED